MPASLNRKYLATSADFSAVVPNANKAAVDEFIRRVKDQFSVPAVALHAEMLAKGQVKGMGTCTSKEIEIMKLWAKELRLNNIKFEG